MLILVTSAVGRGPTPLAAFDAALVAAGVADRNLIYLSSVLPPASRVRRVARIEDTPGTWGDRLYCVLAQASAEVPGAQAWAGVGWGQDATGRGLLVEHHAGDDLSLRRLVATSLDGLCRNRGISLPSRGIEVAGANCATDGEPACALVVAVFEAAAWTTAGTNPAATVGRPAMPAARIAAGHNPARWRM
jgi:arginine decarboxylase